MKIMFCVIFVVLVWYSLLFECVNTWDIDEKLINLNREELVIINVTADTNFKINQTVIKWTSFTLGPMCYTAGIDAKNSKKLIVIFSTLTIDSSRFTNTVKSFDLHENALPDLQWFHQIHKGKRQLMLVVYFPNTKELSWYKFQIHELQKIWTLPLEHHEVTHINIFTISNKNFILIGTSMENNKEKNFRTFLYQFDRDLKNYWFFQSLHLSGSIHSSGISNYDGIFFMALTQKSKDRLEVYVFKENHFIPYVNLDSANITQVVPFENGFKSFLAINGNNAGIYEFTEYGLENSTVINSNIKGLDFWLSIPTHTYRDETFLQAQRTLDHGTHTSFDFDIFTYTGAFFEEHDDIPCNFFGEEHRSLKCLGAFETTLSGINGATHITVEDTLGLLIPNANSSSFLFMINYAIRPLPHPAEAEINKFLVEKEVLKQLLNTNKQHYYKLFNSTQESPEIAENNAPRSALKSVDALKSLAEMERLAIEVKLISQEIDELSNIHSKTKNGNNKTYRNIIFNAAVDIESDLHTIDTSVEIINNQQTDSLLNDIATLNNLEKIEGAKTFFSVTVDNIHFKNINGISNEDFFLKNKPDLFIDGHVNFVKEVTAQNIKSYFVQHIDVEKEWIDVSQRIEGPLTFKILETKEMFNASTINNQNLFYNFNILDHFSDHEITSVYFSGNVTVDNINGEKLEFFLSKLCLNSRKCFIPNLKVLGNVNVIGSSDAEYLNKAKYPEDYVFSEFQNDEEILIDISGIKTFLQIVRGFEVSTNSSVNDLKPDFFITVNTPQNITGRFIFNDVEVKSILEVNGKIKGKSVDNILENLSFEKTDLIKSNVEFLDLEVLGNIIIQNQYCNSSIKQVLNDVILQNQDIANINSTKQFLSSLTVLKNLNIGSLAINNISLNNIATKNANENFNIRKITSIVDIENLTVEGLFDKRNITKLNEVLLKITENTNISSVLIFEQPIEANFLEIKANLNDLTSDQYLYNSVNNTDTRNIVLGDVVVEEIIINGNVQGNILNFNFTDIVKNTLKYTGDKVVKETYLLNKSVLHDLRVKNINNVQFIELFSCNSFEQKLSELTASGTVKVENLRLNGPVNLGTTENKDFSSTLENKLWTKLHTNRSSEIVIEGNVHFNTIKIEDLASVDYTNFIGTLVFKEDETVVIQDTLTFKRNPVVENLLETLTINEIPIANILRNTGEQTISGNITIFGNVTFLGTTFIQNFINDVSTEYLKKYFKINNNSLAINGDVIFKHFVYVKNMRLNGLVNKQSLEKLNNKLVILDKNITLPKDVIFRSKVNVLGNLTSSNHTNGINLDVLYPRIIWVTKNHTIFGPIRFTKSTEVFSALNVDEKLETKFLFNKLLAEIIKNAVKIDEGFLKGKYNFENILVNEILTTQFLNAVNLSTVLPLRISQLITETVVINKLTYLNSIEVNGTVNDRNLQQEIYNTKLINKNQTVVSDVKFSNNVLVQENVTTKNINNKPSEKIVDLNTKQILKASYKFATNIWANQNINLHGLLNGIDISRWNKSHVRSNSKEPQEVIKHLEIKDSLTFLDNFTLIGFMNGINFRNLETNIKDKQKHNFNVGKAIRDDYANLCIDTTYIYKNVQNQIYKFKYFEKFHTLSFSSLIQYVKYFTFNENHYILINEDNCISHLMEFRKNIFQLSIKMYTGYIDQIEVLPNKENLYLVSRHGKGKLKCDIEDSTLIWYLDSKKQIKIMGAMENQDLLQESLVKGTFYGIKNNIVTEFKITTQTEQIAVPNRKWKLKDITENLVFMPRGLKTGLCVKTGKELFVLDRNTFAEKNNENLIPNIPSSNTEEYVIANYTVKVNNYIPGKDGGEILVANVGAKKSQKSLMVVASHRETEVQHRLDLIEIYTDAFSGELFDKIPTYKPSSLVSVEFENEETLLVFLEDKKLIQIYEYKGIEGFKHRSTIRISGNLIFTMELPVEPFLNRRKVLGIVNKNKITLIQAVMSGNRIDEKLACDVSNP